ncbi:hypothetical protein [Aeromicrobium sp. UC242_57]|uniref:hypothetical protein n=1 Tax=Aeromicrobium sp. UC242_57 TaxID=3374624 RepID=UPI0037ABC553
MPEVPGPDEATPMVEIVRGLGTAAAEHWEAEWSSFDIRYIGDNRASDDPQRQYVPGVQRLWFKAAGPLPKVSDRPQRGVHLRQ